MNQHFTLSQELFALWWQVPPAVRQHRAATAGGGCLPSVLHSDSYRHAELCNCSQEPACIAAMPLLRGSTGLPLPAEFANLEMADAEEDIAAGIAAASMEHDEAGGELTLIRQKILQKSHYRIHTNCQPGYGGRRIAAVAAVSKGNGRGGSGLALADSKLVKRNGPCQSGRTRKIAAAASMDTDIVGAGGKQYVSACVCIVRQNGWSSWACHGRHYVCRRDQLAE